MIDETNALRPLLKTSWSASNTNFPSCNACEAIAYARSSLSLIHISGAIDKDNKLRVKRFNDTYHNEAIIGKLGFIDKKWADRLMLGFTYSNMYKDIQTGVRQDIVYGCLLYTSRCV